MIEIKKNSLKLTRKFSIKNFILISILNPISTLPTAIQVTHLMRLLFSSILQIIPPITMHSADGENVAEDEVQMAFCFLGDATYTRHRG
jgi:hypothetical protein